MNPQTLTKYPGELDKSSKKFPCPRCNTRRFVRMLNTETKEYFPDHVGRCDREGGCGYHYTVKQYYDDNGIKPARPLVAEVVQVEPLPVDYMPGDFLLQSMKGYDQTNFAQYLISLFGRDIAFKALEKYCVGRSKMDNGKACIFWNVDKEERIRTGKVICYNPLTGKRNKDIPPFMVHTQYKKDFNKELTFFGAHLLNEYPDQYVGLVESEKTAIIASIFMPDMIWLATGGASGCKWREYAVFKDLKDRSILLFPDFGIFNKKTGKTCFDEWSERAEMIKERMPCTISVSRALEDVLPEEERLNDYDLADILIKRDGGKGWALTDAISEGFAGYPAFWEMKN